MIMEQRYDGEKQYTNHFMYNLPAFKDKRYITVDGKPIFVIWNPFDHSDQISLFIKTWRNLAIQYGVGEFYFVARQIKGRMEDLLALGFDAVYQERVSVAMANDKKYTLKHRLHDKVYNLIGHSLWIDKHDFQKKYKLLTTDEVCKKNVIPTLVAGYDRSPRAGIQAPIFYNFTPESWRLHIRNVFRYLTQKDEEHRIVFLKSWNEWGESNYVEPDIKYGSAILETLKDELSKFDTTEL